MHNTTVPYDVIVVGDEVESILTAVSAARMGVRVLVLRASNGLLGGLSSRGGLSYMDITPEYTGPLFQEFLDRAGVIRVALEPHRAHCVLWSMMQESGVDFFSGEQVFANLSPETGRIESLSTHSGLSFNAHVYIDGTPDADLARAIGVPYLEGLGGILGQGNENFLGVSPVFKIAGVSTPSMQAFEARLRKHPDIETLLKTALPYHSKELRRELVDRPTYSPEGMDYLDILNPTIGIFYHLWRHREVASYPAAPVWIDGANISLLPDGTMGFNGMVARVGRLQELLAFSHGGATPDFLLNEMALFENFLRDEGAFPGAQVIPPSELYVRQTVTLLAKENMTAFQAIQGGVAAEEAIGTFSYWLDLRGVQLSQYFPGETLPKPVFHVGLNVAFPKAPQLENLAFVSRSAGYSPIGQGAGRIVQHNAMLGEAIGIAAALGSLQQKSIQHISAREVREVLVKRQGRPIPLDGKPTLPKECCEESPLLVKDRKIVEAST